MQTSKLRLNADLRKKIGGLIQTHFENEKTTELENFKLAKEDKKSYKQLGNSVNVDNVFTIINSTLKSHSCINTLFIACSMKSSCK